jgi:hypothetical protein
MPRAKKRAVANRPAAATRKSGLSETGVIDASPTKRFFVRMLVRDIELVPAVIDLVDNSVDGAKRMASHAKSTGTKSKPLGKMRIDITLSGDEFRIADNCGGIELDQAVNYAFRFGRPDEVEPIEGEVGQFGVGMKRAVFKMGTSISVTSTAPTSRFEMAINVDRWVEDEENWTFPLEKQHTGERNSASALGTTVVVRDLLPSVAREFVERTFLQRLRTAIEFSHQPALADGLKITLNKKPLRSRAPSLLVEGNDLAPRVIRGKKLSANGDEVKMSLYSGFVELKDEEADTDDPNQFSGLSQAGWYLICNGRLLLFANKERLTGWGFEVADYHPQYRRFRGYVYLTGDSAAMPWNTAKTAVDEDSPIWRAVRSEIVDALREARTVMNRIKAEGSSRPRNGTLLTRKLAEARPVALADLKPNKEMVVPPRPKKAAPKQKTIKYDVPIAQFDDVADYFDLKQPARIGRRVWDYFYDREID